jgi:hypothetical protein
MNRRVIRHILYIVACALTGMEARAQSPGVAIPDALSALTAGPSGCLQAPVGESTRLSFFPGVAFVRGSCIREHGDSTTVLVGIDRDSVLYLASREALNLMIVRHPPRGIGEASVVAYARQALEIAGLESGKATLVHSLKELPSEARDTLATLDPPLAEVQRVGSGTWRLVMTFREPGGYYRPSVVQYSLYCTTDGYLSVISRTLLWRDPQHP